MSYYFDTQFEFDAETDGRIDDDTFEGELEQNDFEREMENAEDGL